MRNIDPILPRFLERENSETRLPIRSMRDSRSNKKDRFEMRFSFFLLKCRIERSKPMPINQDMIGEG